jgi:hypothetical protein
VPTMTPTMPPIPNNTKYRIELSGWDQDEAFFVEKTDLEWNGNERKKVSLRHSLREASVVFVRLLQTSTQSHVCPTAYQVSRFSDSDRSQAYQYILTRLHPQGSSR